jgi:UDPglucose 6-dehydrogenase
MERHAQCPSRALREALWATGAKMRAFDLEVMDECRRIYSERADLDLLTALEAALVGADALTVVTEWKVFRRRSIYPA